MTSCQQTVFPLIVCVCCHGYQGDTSGDYRKTLLLLCGGED